MKKLIRVPLRERLFRRVDKTPTCWLWTGGKTVGGYGQIRAEITHRLTGAHRVSYELHFGQIPLGMNVLHRCDVRNCVNPEHLFIGTTSDNHQDMISKGRSNKAWGESAGRSKLTADQVRNIRSSQRTDTSFAKELNVTSGTVRSARHRITWKRLDA